MKNPPQVSHLEYHPECYIRITRLTFSTSHIYMRLHLYICMVVFGSFRGEEGDSSSVMDLSHISQDKMLPEVSLVNREEDEDENMMIFTHFHLLSKNVFRMC